MRVYLAAALFTQMERNWNRILAAAVERHLPSAKVTLPQDFRTNRKFNDSRHYSHIFSRCLEGIEQADAVLAVLDGCDVDSGASWEIGYAFAKGKPVVGLRTDFRSGAEHGVNLMISRSCRYLVREFSFQEDVEIAAKAAARRLKQLKLD